MLVSDAFDVLNEGAVACIACLSSWCSGVCLMCESVIVYFDVCSIFVSVQCYMHCKRVECVCGIL